MKPVECGYCGNELTAEELADPERNDPTGEYIICDDCHQDNYETECQYCEEYYDTDSEYDATEPGKLIA
ncbi:MAG: hypothetical protein NUV49_04275, partial [Patescibacteria group bacterium]|nr:hypothetical protein [Patescibacteria group bacterium]